MTDAIGAALIGIGGLLFYSAIKNKHPWTEFETFLANKGTT